MARISELLEEILHTRPIHPVIIKAKPGAARSLWGELSQYELTRFAEGIYSAMAVLGLAQGFRGLIEGFDMLSGIFSLPDIEYIADHPLAEAIYPDIVVEAFQATPFPVVPSRGVYKLGAHRRTPLLFTTTYWVGEVLGANECKKHGITGRGVKAAVVDTGAPITHEQLGIRRINFRYHSVYAANRSDANGHGTWCCTALGGRRARADILSRRAGKPVIVEGIAPGVELHCVKAMDYLLGYSRASRIIAGLAAAMRSGAEIVSMSLGAPERARRPEDDPFYHPIHTLASKGVIVVAAAGNNGPREGSINTPGALPDAIAVGAYNPITGRLADFSSRGPTPWGDTKPDVVAPGVNIASGSVGMLDAAVDKFTDMYAILSGTSMATPIAAGVIALAMQLYRDKLGKRLTTGEVKRMMKAYAEEKGLEKDNSRGWGPLSCHVVAWWIETEYSEKTSG